MDILTDVDTSHFDAFVEESTKTLGTDEQKKFIRALALKFIEAVIPRTPVDTGRARAGWTLQRRGPDGSYGRVKTRMLGGVEAEIYNGVPYISYLELGSSRQAPSGFVRLTLREMSGQAAEEGEKWTMEQLRLANNRARRKIGLRRGKRIYRKGTIVGTLDGAR